MKTYIISTFYRFCPLPDFAELKEPLHAAMQANNILGTILLASEGMNGGMGGTPRDMANMYAAIRADDRFSDLHFKETTSDMMPYEKIKVKLRKEIVALGVENVDPLQITGTHVTPAQWNELLADPDVLVIDNRNTYEIEYGTFENAINPNTENFRDFPAYIQENLLDKKHKKIAMCCTGGIRCEKSSSYLKMLGFEQVYQLEGGIIDYMKAVPAEESKWQGQCFVFDERIAIADAS